MKEFPYRAGMTEPEGRNGCGRKEGFDCRHEDAGLSR